MKLFGSVLLALTSVAHAGASKCVASKVDHSSSPLHLNHAQVLGSHNSYHLRSAVFNYSHPVLTAQLDGGVRAFELDIFYDFTINDYRVLHVVGADEGTNCKTLTECLSLLQAWSKANPSHFPFFVQLEFSGGIKKSKPSESNKKTCAFSDVAGVTSCTARKCYGVLVPGVVKCIGEKCAMEAFGAATANSACASLTVCLNLEIAKLDKATKLTLSLTNTLVKACVASDVAKETKVSIQADALEVKAAAAKLLSVLDAHWPSTRRIAPKDIFNTSFSEAAAMKNYCSHAGIHPNCSNFWPTVESSRGKALFWLTHAPWMEPYMSSATRPVFVDGVDKSVQKADDPASWLITLGAEANISSKVKTGVLVRTRSDKDLKYDASRRDAALVSGAMVVSTDLFPTAVDAPKGPADWAGMNKLLKKVHIPGGMPVRCNPVTTGSAHWKASKGPRCTSLMLEDPVSLSCAPGTAMGTTTITTITTTTNTATTVTAKTTITQTNTVVSITSTTTNPPSSNKPGTKQITVSGEVKFVANLPTSVSAASFVKDAKVKLGVEKGIANKLRVPAAWVSATLAIAARRLSIPGRRLATSNINVDFTVTIPPGSKTSQSAASLKTSLTSANSTTFGTALLSAIKAEDSATYKDLQVTVSSVNHVAPKTMANLPTRKPSEGASVPIVGFACHGSVLSLVALSLAVLFSATLS